MVKNSSSFRRPKSPRKIVPGGDRLPGILSNTIVVTNLNFTGISITTPNSDSKKFLISKKYPFAVWISKTPFSLHSLHRNRPSPSAQESSSGIGREQESQRFACSTQVLQNNTPGMEFNSNFSPGKSNSLQQSHRFSCSKQ